MSTAGGGISQTVEAMSRASALTFTGVGVVFFILGVWARLHWLDAPFGGFDEGILLSDTNSLFFGAAPYRDFYSNYAPGIFLLIAAAWKVFGVSGFAIRFLAFLFEVALSLLAGRVAAKMTRHRFSWFACGAVSVWTTLLGPSLSAWLVGLVLALLFVDSLLWALESGGRIRLVVAGLALGLLGCFRHDLFVYFVALFVPSWMLPGRVYKAVELSAPPRRMLAFVLLGAFLPLLLVWIPCFYSAGIRRVTDDLFFTQVRYVMPARVLPFPNLIAITHRGLPAFLARPFEGALVLTFLAPFLAVVLLGLRRVLKAVRRDLAVFWMACLSLAVIPQMFGRTDPIHASYTVTPCLILVTVFLESVISSRATDRLRLGLAAIPLGFLVLAFSTKSPIWPPAPILPIYVGGSSYRLVSPRPGFHNSDPEVVSARQAVFDFVEAHTSPNEAVYFGTDRHDRVFTNEADLYFLSNRRAGTRYIQFDPNVVTRNDVQLEMIASLERNNVRLVVLSGGLDPKLFENQPGVLPGSTALDDYLHAHFAAIESQPPYVIYTRRD